MLKEKKSLYQNTKKEEKEKKKRHVLFSSNKQSGKILISSHCLALSIYLSIVIS